MTSDWQSTKRRDKEKSTPSRNMVNFNIKTKEKILKASRKNRSHAIDNWNIKRTKHDQTEKKTKVNKYVKRRSTALAKNKLQSKTEWYTNCGHSIDKKIKCQMLKRWSWDRCCWCKLVRPLHKSARHYAPKLNLHIPYDWAIQFFHICKRENRTHVHI